MSWWDTEVGTFSPVAGGPTTPRTGGRRVLSRSRYVRTVRVMPVPVPLWPPTGRIRGIRERSPGPAPGRRPSTTLRSTPTRERDRPVLIRLSRFGFEDGTDGG